ncbi:uncharacterized membrane protein [Tanacetum coccineum]
MNGRIKEGMVDVSSANDDNTSLIAHANTGVSPKGDIIREVNPRHPRHNHAHIAFAPDEFLTRIHGYNCLNEHGLPPRLLSPEIETNNKSYGPFGDGFNEPPENVEPYSFNIGRKRFRGFHGSVCKDIVATIGLWANGSSNSSLVVSILVLQKYETPVLACAISEVLSSLAEVTSTMPSLILPFILDSSKIKLERKSSTNENIYGIQIGPQTDMTQALSSRHVKAPSSMQIHHEPLSCALQLVRVLKTSTFILVGQSGQHKSATDDLEVICKIGETLASASSLQFVKEKVTWNPKKTSKELKKEPWRALYG